MSVILSIDDSGNLIDQSGNFVDRQGNIRQAAEANPESGEQQTENQLIDQPTEER